MLLVHGLFFEVPSCTYLLWLCSPIKDATLLRYGQDPDDFEYAMSEFLRMNGMYWGVACMDLIDRLHEMDR